MGNLHPFTSTVPAQLHSFYLSVCLPVCPRICLSVLSVCLPACLFVSLATCLPVCICLSTCFSTCLPLCLTCLFTCQSPCLPVCVQEEQTDSCWTFRSRPNFRSDIFSRKFPQRLFDSECCLVSMTTGSEPSGPNSVGRSTQQVTLTTAVTSLTLTEWVEF